MFKRLKLIKSLKEFIGWFMYRVCPNWMSDRFYLEMYYLFTKREHLNLDNPKTFNEKLQWLKIYNRNPEYVRLVDKYLVKEWVAGKIGYQYIIPTLAKFDTADELSIDQLPNQFVLKCNHDSGSVIVCKDKATFDLEQARTFYKDRLQFNYFDVCGEWVYRDVPRCIIAEQYMEEFGNADLMDYKFFCFDGVPRIMYMSRDHAAQCTTDFFDMEFNRLPIRMQAPPSKETPAKPAQFEDMKRLAAVLSQGIPQVRVDFYIINNQIYFGELTFYHCGGMVTVQPYEWNLKMGDMINLPVKQE
jgi:hypothetical protein